MVFFLAEYCRKGSPFLRGEKSWKSKHALLAVVDFRRVSVGEMGGRGGWQGAHPNSPKYSK